MNNYKKLILLLVAFPAILFARMQNDPVLLKVNHKEISLSEFEKDFHQATRLKGRKKDEVKEFMNLYILNHLKISDAEAKGIDTLANIQSQLLAYRNQLIKSYYTSRMEDEFFSAYLQEYKQKHPKEQRQIIQIHKKIPQITDQRFIKAISLWMDSLYQVSMKNQGQDFITYVKTYSDDKNTSWITRLETSKEFENRVFSLREGEISKPFFTPEGIHIVKLLQKKEQAPPEETEKLARQRWIRKNRLNPDFKQSLIIREKLTEQQPPKVEQLVKKYREQLLLTEINKKEVDEKLNDSSGLHAYFQTHKKDYKWDPVRYRGIVVHCKDKKLFRKAKRLVKGLPISEWEDIIDSYFNSGAAPLVRVEKNDQCLFAIGDNQYVDILVFKKKENIPSINDFPYTDVIGRKVKNPDSYQEVLEPLKADYKKFLESLWISRLQANSKVEINEEVLKTVNNH